MFQSKQTAKILAWQTYQKQNKKE